MTPRSLASFIIVAFALHGSDAATQQRTPDLAKLAPGRGLQVLVSNRNVSPITDGARAGLQLSAGPGEGPAYLDGVALANGTIEVDLRGKDLQEQSFLGIAFHGVDSTTYDAIYFRPFNFRAPDSTRHAHAVQYISQPTNTWQKLRTEQPGVFEKAVNPAPDPNGWFHARIVVAGPQVSVFLDGATNPSLVVTRLSDRGHGRVGLWVGNGSGGDFANLVIKPAP
jgi:hypothetical protein